MNENEFGGNGFDNNGFESNGDFNAFDTPQWEQTPAPEAPNVDLNQAAEGTVEQKPRNYERYMEQGTWTENQQQTAAPNPGVGDFQSSFNGGYPNTTPSYNIEGLEEPMGIGEWLITMLLMAIPCVNIILLFVWGFGSSEKKSKSNFCKAYLIGIGIALLIYILMIVVMLIFGFSAASLARW